MPEQTRESLEEKIASIHMALAARGYRAVRIAIEFDYTQGDEPIPIFTVHHEPTPTLPA
jgi:hypothetical protein